jgi:hypothetical protein
MRVCRYEVIGFDNGDLMPSTTMSNSTIGTRFVSHDEDVDDNDDDDDDDDVASDSESDIGSSDDYDGYDDPFDFWVPLTLTDIEKQMLHRGDIIGTIKAIRDRRPGTGLQEAKAVCDVYRTTIGHVSQVTHGRVVDLMEPKDKGYVIREPKRKAKKGFAKLDKLDSRGLMQQSLEDLREYAGKGLSIVGASKIPGGKSALVSKILAVRA